MAKAAPSPAPVLQHLTNLSRNEARSPRIGRPQQSLVSSVHVVEYGDIRQLAHHRVVAVTPTDTDVSNPTASISTNTSSRAKSTTPLAQQFGS